MSVRPVRSLLLALLALTVAGAAAADFRLERELALEPGGRLELDADVGSVSVAGDSRSGASVLVTSSRDDIEDRYEFTFDEAPGKVVIRAKKKRRLSWSSRDGNLHFEIQVPTDTELDLSTAGGSVSVRDTRGDAELHTSGGRIQLSSLGGDVRAHTSGGSIEASDLDGDVRLHTSGGRIEAERISGSVDAETSGGSVMLKDVGGRIDASSSGGPVTAYLAAGNAEGGSLSTSGGGVTVYVDPSVGLDIDASTSGGSVTVDLPVTVQGKLDRGSLRGQLNGGGATLRMRSSGGGIRIRGL